MNILSFGEIIWDIYDDKKLLGGAPLNFAAHAVKQGADAWILSSVGNDALGDLSIESINKFNVNTEYVSKNNHPTGRCKVTLDKHKIPHYNLIDNAAYDFIDLPILSQNFDAISFGTLALRGKGNIHILEKILEKYKFKIIFSDLNIRPPHFTDSNIDFCLAKSNIVKISDEELPIIVKSSLKLNDLNVNESILKLSEKYKNIDLFIITKGSDGAVAYDAKAEAFFSCPAQEVTVVSTVGAGDSFGAAFLVEFFKSKNIKNALIKATQVSAYVVSQLDTIPE